MDNCIFCKIIKGEIPCYKVYEDDVCLAFLDIAQGTIGHTLVVPKDHYENLLEIKEDVLGHCMVVAQKIAKSLMNLDDVKGINIVNNCGVLAGQSVMHFHIHIIPRREVGEIDLETHVRHELSNEEFNNLASKIKEKI